METERRGQPAAGRKDDLGKPRWDLVPHEAHAAMVDVLTFGAKKYAAGNWANVKGWRWRYYRAALGHLYAWWRGERIDPESGLPHLAHALCSVAFLLEQDLRSARGESVPDGWEGSSPVPALPTTLTPPGSEPENPYERMKMMHEAWKALK